MATLVTPTGLQKLEFDVTTAEGPSRVTIITGSVPIDCRATSTPGSDLTQKESFKVLLDPTLDPGQFRKAISTRHVVSHHDTRAPQMAKKPMKVATSATPLSTSAASWRLMDALYHAAIRFAPGADKPLIWERRKKPNWRTQWFANSLSFAL
jgi:hypothetical protein